MPIPTHHQLLRVIFFRVLVIILKGEQLKSSVIGSLVMITDESKRFGKRTQNCLELHWYFINHVIKMDTWSGCSYMVGFSKALSTSHTLLLVKLAGILFLECNGSRVTPGQGIFIASKPYCSQAANSLGISLIPSGDPIILTLFPCPSGSPRTGGAAIPWAWGNMGQKSPFPPHKDENWWELWGWRDLGWVCCWGQSAQTWPYRSQE